MSLLKDTTSCQGRIQGEVERVGHGAIRQNSTGVSNGCRKCRIPSNGRTAVSAINWLIPNGLPVILGCDERGVHRVGFGPDANSGGKDAGSDDSGGRRGRRAEEDRGSESEQIHSFCELGRRGLGGGEGTLCACRGGTLGFPRRDVQRLSIKRRGPRCPHPGADSLRPDATGYAYSGTGLVGPSASARSVIRLASSAIAHSRRSSWRSWMRPVSIIAAISASRTSESRCARLPWASLRRP